jgi:hypothetical protein
LGWAAWFSCLDCGSTPQRRVSNTHQTYKNNPNTLIHTQHTHTHTPNNKENEKRKKERKKTKKQKKKEENWSNTGQTSLSLNFVPRSRTLSNLAFEWQPGVDWITS